MKCRQCQEILPRGKQRCAHCNAWTIPITAQDLDKDGTILLSDKSVKPARRIPIEWLSEAFGGGLISTSTTLLGGAPGAGKSTLAFQLASMVAGYYKKKPADNSGEILIIPAEQSLTDLRGMVDNLNVKHTDKFRMMPVLEGFEANVDEVIALRKPALVIIDSLPKFTNNDMAAALDLCKVSKRHAVSLQAPFILIDHITKDDQLAGLKALEHEVDGTFLLMHRDKGSPSRSFTALKNRNGPDIEVCLTMGDRGLGPCEGCPYCAEQENHDDFHDD